jgi:hypothetical protein
MDSVAIGAAVVVGGLFGHFVTVWYINRKYILWRRDVGVRADIE